jgi:hypothetical protein
MDSERDSGGRLILVCKDFESSGREVSVMAELLGLNRDAEMNEDFRPGTIRAS